jgi:hypothetical protein
MCYCLFYKIIKAYKRVLIPYRDGRRLPILLAVSYVLQDSNVTMTSALLPIHLAHFVPYDLEVFLAMTVSPRKID